VIDKTSGVSASPVTDSRPRTHFFLRFSFRYAKYPAAEAAANPAPAKRAFFPADIGCGFTGFAFFTRLDVFTPLGLFLIPDRPIPNELRVIGLKP
jgi:hypothetical protein